MAQETEKGLRQATSALRSFMSLIEYPLADVSMHPVLGSRWAAASLGWGGGAPTRDPRNKKAS